MIGKLFWFFMLFLHAAAFPRFAGPRWGSFTSNTPRIRDGYATFNSNMLGCISGNRGNRINALLRCVNGRKWAQISIDYQFMIGTSEIVAQRSRVSFNYSTVKVLQAYIMYIRFTSVCPNYKNTITCLLKWKNILWKIKLIQLYTHWFS